jgi:hypothetical protein
MIYENTSQNDDTIIDFLDIIHRSFFFLIKNQRIRHWTLSPSSGKNLLSWAKSIELVPVSGLSCWDCARVMLDLLPQ